MTISRWLAMLGLGGALLGCPGGSPPSSDEDSTPAEGALAPEELRRQAHAQAMAMLRRDAPAALRMLDPVAAAEVEGTPLHPPQFGAAARAARREVSVRLERDAAAISLALSSPQDGVILRALQTAFEREEQHRRRPPWRDDPHALVHAIEPYLHALSTRLAAGRCDDGCGLSELGPALRLGLAELGSASEPTMAAAREDLTALRGMLSQWTDGMPASHPVVLARGPLEADLDFVLTELAREAAALAAAPELPWSEAVAPATLGGWKRRPARWGAARLRHVLEDEEAYGLAPDVLFQRAEGTVLRLWAMLERSRRTPVEETALPRPFDAAACEAVWTSLGTWILAQGEGRTIEPPCDAVLQGVGDRPEPATDADLVLQLIELGTIEPTRRAHLAATGIDVALVHGRAAPLAQGLVLKIAIAAGSGRRGAERLAVEHALHRACLAAAAVWIHGELGDVDALAPRLEPLGCGEVTALVSAAEARPRTALEGLGLVLVGDGPSDAAALDRYWWAPMGLVHDLALPPTPSTEAPAVRFETLEPNAGGSIKSPRRSRR
ncbi:hypothetical protein [Paraliomyxa miuraensis]|uniref:hypothetical protein n=1 Tax=Paraliomyxa miuraensis TaxID=376150 RepID=UPI0022519CCF|nr:hypothetical protein [Paraliomyxa miuraensis]MCX4243682.1 hypothetical protein [Paraliomyxa miuraensis]